MQGKVEELRCLDIGAVSSVCVFQLCCKLQRNRPTRKFICLPAERHCIRLVTARLACPIESANTQTHRFANQHCLSEFVLDDEPFEMRPCGPAYLFCILLELPLRSAGRSSIQSEITYFMSVLTFLAAGFVFQKHLLRYYCIHSLLGSCY